MKKGVTKAEYVKLIRRTETALKRELKKRTEEQDLDLIKECVESLAYYRSELDELRAAGSHSRSFGFVRSAAAAMLALVLTFAIGATIAQAAGVRVWTAIFTRDAGYLRIDYCPSITEAPTEPPAQQANSDEEKTFFFFDQFAEEMRIRGYPVFIEGWLDYRFMEGEVRSFGSSCYSSYTMTGSEGFIKLTMYAKDRPDGRVSVWGLKEDIPITELDIRGVRVFYQVDGSIAFASWQYGNCIFSLSLSGRADMIEDLLYEVVDPRSY